jgi:hypothetical membrane protein
MSTMNRTAIRRPTAADEGSSPLNRTLALGGVVGPVILFVAFTVAGFLRPGYSPIHNAISDLGAGSNPWLLNLSLLLLGVLLAAFVVAFYRTLGHALGDPWRWVCAVLLLMPGLGFAWAGIFTVAPSTVTLHWVVGEPLLGIGTIVGFFLTGLRLRRLPEWTRWGAYSIVASVAAVALTAVEFGFWMTGLGGLLERLLFVDVLGWYVVFGWRLWARSPTATGQPGSL